MTRVNYGKMINEVNRNYILNFTNRNKYSIATLIKACLIEKGWTKSYLKYRLNRAVSIKNNKDLRNTLIRIYFD